MTKLDAEGTAMEARLPLTGRAALRLTHEWADGAGGARLRSTLRLGAAAGALHSPPLRVRPHLLSRRGELTRACFDGPHPVMLRAATVAFCR